VTISCFSAPVKETLLSVGAIIDALPCVIGFPSVSNFCYIAVSGVNKKKNINKNGTIKYLNDRTNCIIYYSLLDCEISGYYYYCWRGVK
jgi:hypothetical protein